MNDLSSRPVQADLSRFGFDYGRWGRADRRMGLATGERFGTGEGLALISTIPATESLRALPLLHQSGLILGLLLVSSMPFILSWFVARRVLLVDLIGHPGEATTMQGLRIPSSPMAKTIPEILADTKESTGAKRRLVLVSALPDPEDWSDFVKKKTDGAPDFHQVHFGRAWSKVEGALAERGSDGGDGEAKSSHADDFHKALCADVGSRKGAEESTPILLIDFEPDLADDAAAADQIRALRRLVEGENRSMVILSEHIPDLGLAEAVGRDDAEEGARRRWIEFFGSFSLKFAGDIGKVSFKLKFAETLEKIRALTGRLSANESDDSEKETRLEQLRKEGYLELEKSEDRAEVERIESVVRLTAAECHPTPVLKRIGYGLIDTVNEGLDLFRREDPDPAKPDGETDPGHDKHTKKRDEQGASEQARNLLRLITREYVYVKIGSEARLHYRYLWDSCTTDEKLVLVQLAEQGIVNPKYFGWIADLMNRGLVARDPELRLMNKSFERFVKQEVRESDVLEWEEQAGPSGWSVLKWILPAPLLGLGFFLFITQRDALSSVTGLVVAVASLAPFVINLYSKFQEINVRGRAETERRMQEQKSRAKSGSDGDD